MIEKPSIQRFSIMYILVYQKTLKPVFRLQKCRRIIVEVLAQIKTKTVLDNLKHNGAPNGYSPW